MTPAGLAERRDLARKLSEAEATIEALLSGQIDAAIDPRNNTPVLLTRAEAALRESEEAYRQIVETTTDGIIKVDRAARVVFANRRFAEMLGYQPREIIGISVFAFMSTAAGVTAAESFRLHGGLMDAVDTTLRQKDGTEISVNITGSPLTTADGQYIGNLAVIRDVTEQKRMHSQLMVSDRMASVGTLAAGVAHEINNPLAAVIANLVYVDEAVGRLLTLDPAVPGATALFEDMKGPLEDARDGAQRVRLIVRDLMIFSRSPIDEPRGPVDVKAIMESSLRMARNEVRHRAQLVRKYSRVPGVEANEARLGQVFLNLIVNAAQALPEGRAENNQITVSTRRVGERVVIEVADSGPGIPPEIMGRIFDAFFTTKAVGVGSGLGLAICQRIITDMGGTLSVESEVGRGSAFCVSLPIAHGITSRLLTPIDAIPIAGRRGRVLVVDDEALVLRIVQRVLGRDHDIVPVSSAKEALALCESGEMFDLILCDLMMPDMTGMDLHHALSIVAPELATRMVFLTGGAFTEKAQQFLAEPSKEYIEKPFDAGNLRAIVRRHLQ